MDDEPLAFLLLRASRWFDRQLLERLEARGWPRLSSAQSLVFPHLVQGGVSPAALARALGSTRQSSAELVGGLVRLGLLESRVDGRSPRRRVVVLTPRGEQLAADARTVLDELEAELARGPGGVDVRALRSSLVADAFTGRRGQAPPGERSGAGQERADR
ncbi:MarR family winged helix-turn-helix transcriptional regulator [Pseudokineococcus sp. 1T1Z-3]|uniref:MarR family winged helix-turn-helix transcriptional regulator n=1 Tax=Pseudokineococcus sp. 1T1Z-3 TaxID=3132745 RepID=UPI00309CA3FB